MSTERVDQGVENDTPLSESTVFWFLQKEHTIERVDAVREWAAGQLRTGSLLYARQGFRSLAAVGVTTTTSLSDCVPLSTDSGMTLLEAEVWFRNGQLRNGLYCFSLFNAYQAKAKAKAKNDEPHVDTSVPSELLIACGQSCENKRNFIDAIEAYTLARSFSHLQSLIQMLKGLDLQQFDTYKDCLQAAEKALAKLKGV